MSKRDIVVVAALVCGILAIFLLETLAVVAWG
jgi:hypothetical protein